MDVTALLQPCYKTVKTKFNKNLTVITPYELAGITKIATQNALDLLPLASKVPIGVMP